jgi:hypothetical protein
MITDWQIQRKGAVLILGIAVAENAVLDIVSDDALLANCLEMLERPHADLVDTQMGRFGEFPIRLNLHHDDTVSIFIDGPDFDTGRSQSAAIWVEKNGLRDILQQVIRAAAEPGDPPNGGSATRPENSAV